MLKIPPKSVLYNNQIELRLMSPREGHLIYQGVLASLPELKPFMHWAHYEFDLEKACSIYADFEAKSLRGEEINFAGFDPSTGEFRLCCSLSPASRLNPLAFEIGYWVASNHTGKGLGTLAAKILTLLAFREYNANRISAVCNQENKRSLKVIENLGFRFEGTLRNHQMKPTPAMIDGGYSPITDSLSFSLIPDDLASLSWVDETNAKLSVTHYYS